MRARAVTFWLLVLGLLAPGGVLTLARLSDPVSQLGLQAVAFTPYALVLYAATLIVVLFAAVRRHRSRLLLLPGALALAGLLGHAVWAAPLVSGEGRAPAAGAEPVTVMSSNLYYGRGDGTAVVLDAARRDVDVLVVSEVTARTLAEMERAAVAALYPYRAGEAGDANEGTMVFSRTPVSDVEVVAGTTFDNLLVRTGGLSLLAAHPAAPLDPEDWRRDHDLLRAAVARARPDVVVGDLNATFDHAPLRTLAEAGYRGSLELLDGGLAPTWPANGLYEPLRLFPPLVRIDHVLLAPGWTVGRADTLEIPDTDHLAVLATVLRSAPARAQAAATRWRSGAGPGSAVR